MDIKTFAYEKQLHSSQFEDIIVVCKDLLFKSPNAKDYRDYIRSRITDRNIDKFDIGYFPPLNNISELTKFISEQTLYDLRLLNDRNTVDGNNIILHKINFFENHGVIFPFRDERGNILSMSGRSLLSDEEMQELGIQKYKNLFFDKSLHLYGLDKAKRSIIKNNYVILVEGQVDCISCHERGIYNVVSVMGSSLSRYQFYLLKKYTNNFACMFDNDGAGEKAYNKTIKKYSKYANCIKKIEYPVIYNDVDEYMRKCGDTSIFNFSEFYEGFHQES
jgi:DNA primase